MPTTSVSVEAAAGEIALRRRTCNPQGLPGHVKRSIDVGVITLMLPVVLPLMALIAAAVKLTSPGPALFRQSRVTQGGRAFVMLKFRTMRERRADDRLDDVSDVFHKLGKNDPRITPIGRTLRRFSLDELPQLFNVLRGDMSLIGPRPLPVDQVAANSELFDGRHEMPAGLSGWWQVNGRSDLDPLTSVRMDLFYIDNWSLGLDLRIVLRTARAILGGRGAY